MELSFPLKSTSFPGFSFSGLYGAREERVGEKPGNEVGLKCIVGFHMTSLKFNKKIVDPTEILLSRCIRAAEN